MVPNKTLETPNYKLERLKHDDPRLDNIEASYKLELPFKTSNNLLRFTCSLLLSRGEDVVSVSGRLGHASPSITTDMYAHAMPERDRDCASVMGDVFAPQVKQGRIIKLKTA